MGVVSQAIISTGEFDPRGKPIVCKGLEGFYCFLVKVFPASSKRHHLIPKND
jgi:hypothetical protein